MIADSRPEKTSEPPGITSLRPPRLVWRCASGRRVGGEGALARAGPGASTGPRQGGRRRGSRGARTAAGRRGWREEVGAPGGRNGGPEPAAAEVRVGEDVADHGDCLRLRVYVGARRRDEAS